MRGIFYEVAKEHIQKPGNLEKFVQIEKILVDCSNEELKEELEQLEKKIHEVKREMKRREVR